jgi:CRP/FNR family transcriptional regulator, nitrogen oxide reductase regulator
MIETTQQSPLLEISELFADLPSSVCTDIVSMARPRDYACRQVIFFAGDPIKETLLLTDGRAKIMQLGECGTEVILRFTVPGEVIGELGLVPGDTHSSTAVALQNCKVLVWGAAAFEAALERFPILQRNAERIIQRRLEQLESRFCEVATELASPRLAHTLVRLIDQMGHKVNSHVEVNISQEALAQMTAMTTFTVNRLLTNWENQGMLRVRREAIEIHSFLPLLSLCKVA